MAMPTRRQALVAAFLQDGWEINEDLCTIKHKVLEYAGRAGGRAWISPNGHVRVGLTKGATQYVHANPGNAKETIEEMINRGRNVLS